MGKIVKKYFNCALILWKIQNYMDTFKNYQINFFDGNQLKRTLIESVANKKHFENSSKDNLLKIFDLGQIKKFALKNNC